ncbi:hypothetical protein GOBAR_AA09304 [Gossypium barbadense]|uniref:WLM domain-containing protein n=1 Tax=Gossypium barbadense TaxID=3634 RepID=A0A2P5Y6X1_GOSBA|nr:hypothetical protein GOBAR_AA09304 [Gossypium barbadense]
MLHELCHNTHGPHNASFCKLWDELRKNHISPSNERFWRVRIKSLINVTGGSQDVPIYGFTVKHYLCGKGRTYECEELMSKGITGTGEGFDLLGRRLGGFSRHPPLSSLRQTASAAAENRARLGSLSPSGPKRLGGDSTVRDALSPIQADAMAAERRL